MEEICYIMIDNVVYTKLNKYYSTPIDDQIPLPYFTRFIFGKQSTYLYVETASGRFANTIFSKLGYFAGFGLKIIIKKLNNSIIKIFKPHAKCLRPGYPGSS